MLGGPYVVEIVQLRSSPNMADIPGRLRKMADDIESGEVKASSVLLIIPRDSHWPDVWGWGEDLGDMGRIGLLELTKAFFTNNKTVRETGD